MAWSSDYLENQRGQARKSFRKQAEALGVSDARGGDAAQQARSMFDRGQLAQDRAMVSYERHRPKWVMAEFKKLQGKSWSGRYDLKPIWAGRENGLMQQAEKNVLNRHKNRLLRIEQITRREIARVTREHARNRSR